MKFEEKKTKFTWEEALPMNFWEGAFMAFIIGGIIGVSGYIAGLSVIFCYVFVKWYWHYVKNL